MGIKLGSQIADATDKYCRIGESTAMESMKRFCHAVRTEFGPHYLRQPTRADFEARLRIDEARGFLGMFASLDCMHYVWKNCPVAWQGDYGDRDGAKSIILEAILLIKVFISGMISSVCLGQITTSMYWIVHR